MATKHLVLGTTILFCAAAFAQSTPASSGEAVGARETGSGMATGKRQHQPVVIRKEVDASTPAARETGSGMATGKTASPTASPDIKAPRDAASGQASGKRMHEPAKIEIPNAAVQAQSPSGTHHLEQKNIVHRDLAAREASSGQASGKRENKVEPIAIKQEVASPRDSATGMATGKRMHKPITITKEIEPSSATTARETGSGMATGKRGIITGKDNDTGVAGHDVKAPRDSATGMATGKRQPMMSNAQSNPMYKDKGTSGVNPLYESKDDKRVQSGLNATGSAVASGAAVVKTKTKSNQSNDRVAAGDVNGDGVADPQKASINTTRSNIKHQRAAEFTGNGTPDPSAMKITKSRSNIQNNRVSGGPVAADLDGDALPDRKPAPTATPAKKADPYGNITWDSTGTAGSDKKAAPKK